MANGCRIYLVIRHPLKKSISADKLSSESTDIHIFVSVHLAAFLLLPFFMSPSRAAIIAGSYYCRCNDSCYCLNLCRWP